MQKLLIAVIAVAFIAGLWTGIYLARREANMVRVINANSANIQKIADILSRRSAPQTPAPQPAE